LSAPRGVGRSTLSTRRVIVRSLAVGVVFGVVLVKSEAVSWFRIQEMFRFQGFHMYGLLGSAIVVGMASVAALRRFGLGGLGGDVQIGKKVSRGLNRQYWMGGTVFGLGWGLLGACPGPIYAMIGTGASVYVAALVSALLGVWTYAALRPHLPHF